MVAIRRGVLHNRGDHGDWRRTVLRGGATAVGLHSCATGVTRLETFLCWLPSRSPLSDVRSFWWFTFYERATPFAWEPAPTAPTRRHAVSLLPPQAGARSILSGASGIAVGLATV